MKTVIMRYSLFQHTYNSYKDIKDCVRLRMYFIKIPHRKSYNKRNNKVTEEEEDDDSCC